METTEREFTIIIPHSDNDGHTISTDVAKRYARSMSKHFGGVTVIPHVLGCFVNDKNKLQCEENTMLTAARDSTDKIQFSKDRLFMAQLAKRAGEELGQESIMWNEDIIKDVDFIEGSYKKSLPYKLRENDIFKKVL